MKIFVLSNAYPYDGNPSANIFIYDLLKSIKGNNEFIILDIQNLSFKLFFKKTNKNIIERKDDIGNILSIKNKTIKFCHFFNRESFGKKADILYSKAVEKYGIPDLIYAHFSCYAGYSAALLSKKYNIPLVTHEHDGRLLSKKLPKFLRKTVKFVYEQSIRFICVSENLKNVISSIVRDNKKIIVVPNQISNMFRYYPKTKHSAVNFLCVSRFDPGKRIDLLVSCFAEVFKNKDEANLLIIGDGRQRKKIEKLISKLNCANITLLGRINHENILKYYVDCDCFVLPSQFETFGIVYREALGIGRPIITTNHKGFAANEFCELDGIMIEIDSKNQLKNALRDMYDNIDKYDNEEISKRCLMMYDYNTITNSVCTALLESYKKI